MIEYNISELHIGNEHIVYRPVFINYESAVLSSFISSEVRCFPNDILQALEDVLSGEKENSAFAGNALSITVNGDTSTIECELDDVDMGPDCVINTRELYDLIVRWLKDVKTTSGEKI